MKNVDATTAYVRQITAVGIASVAIVSLLTGCAPGMSMTNPPTFFSSPANTKYNRITVDLIKEIEEKNKSKWLDQKKAAQSFKSKGEYKYLIGPHDVLSVTVWDHPELTIPAGSFRSAEAAGHLVADDGTIFFPYAGKVKVAGKTIPQVRDLLTRSISKNIANPQLDVRVVSFRSQKAYIVGEVAEPGPLPITDSPMRVVDAINQAGDITPEANLLGITLTRDKSVVNIDLSRIYAGDFSQNYLLNDGDILHVPDLNQQKVFVLGEVARPTSLFMTRGKMSLSEAISDAGGVDRVTSDPQHIYVIRGTPSMREIFYINGKSPDALIIGDLFKLQARDIVYVDTAGITRWNRVIEQLLPTANFINATSEAYDRHK